MLGQRAKLVYLLLCLVIHTSSQILSFPGDDGVWSSKRQIPEYKYACGAQLYIQAPLKNGDEIAANGVRFRYCDGVNWQQDGNIEATTQTGTWRGMKMCPVNQFISGFKVRYHGEGPDKTAFNGLIIYCRSPANPFLTEVVVDQGYWGNWKTSIVSNQEFIVSLKIRAVPYQPSTLIKRIPHQRCGKRNWLGRRKCHTQWQQQIIKLFDNTGMNGLEVETKPFRQITKTSIHYNFPPSPVITPRILQSFTLTNELKVPAKKTISFSKGQKFTQKWSLNNSFLQSQTSTKSFTVRKSQSKSNSIPFLKKSTTTKTQQTTTSISTTEEAGRQITFGTAQEFSVSSSHSLEVVVPACSIVIIQSIIRTATLSVPFSLIVEYQDKTFRIASGIYDGVVVSQVEDYIKNGGKPTGC